MLWILFCMWRFECLHDLITLNTFEYLWIFLHFCRITSCFREGFSFKWCCTRAKPRGRWVGHLLKGKTCWIFRCGNLGVWQSRMDSNEHNELILGIFWKCTIETETVVVMENSWWEVSPSAGILGSYHKGEIVVSLSLSAKIKQELKTRPLAKSSAMLFPLWIGTRIFWIHSCLTATAQWTGVCP